MMRGANDKASSRRLRRRYRAERRFKFYCIAALLVAVGFLVLFFANMIATGYSAFVQTEILIQAEYNEQTVGFPALTVSKQMQALIGRAWFRSLPLRVQDNPALMGTTRPEWVPAKSDVDQYYKGFGNQLSSAEQALFG
ncbi:MAG: DUF3333 domain-containing protein, partial [Salinisphaera sp.]|nr:DUF3333 domain-containing protein [Salinisphaera sp.]